MYLNLRATLPALAATFIQFTELYGKFLLQFRSWSTSENTPFGGPAVGLDDH